MQMPPTSAATVGTTSFSRTSLPLPFRRLANRTFGTKRLHLRQSTALAAIISTIQAQRFAITAGYRSMARQESLEADWASAFRHSRKGGPAGFGHAW